ncbi:MAG: hypothetical protein AB8F78_11645 [Saprospiraceae bacterium]
MKFSFATPFPFSLLVLLCSATLLLGSCTCLTCDDDGDPVGMPTENAAWDTTTVSTTERIIALHSKPDELLAFTKSEFLRIAAITDNVIERRTFLPRYQALGQPAVNDLMFARGLSDTRDGADIVEFQLVLNPAEVERFYIDSITTQLLAIEDDGAQIGAFNDLGTIYVQPVIQRNERRLGMLIFSLTTDQTFTEFTDVSFVGLIDFPTVREAARVVSSIRFIDDHFYIATKFGAYRLSESGVLETLIASPTDIRDIFKYDGRFYATQVSLAPMFVSNSGQNWQSSGIVTDLRLVDVFGDQLVSQELEGWRYNLTDDLMQIPEELEMNESFGNLTNDQFFGIDKLGSSFYLGFENRLYKTDSLRVTP